MRSLSLLCMTLAVAGCHHTPTVIQTGPDTYLAGAVSRSGFKNDMDVTSAAMTRANDFCRRQGKVADMIDNTSRGQQALTTQTAQVRFRCVDAATPAPAASGAS